MGVGYQTAAPVFVDNKMLQLPYQEMAEAIDRIDAGVEKSLAQASALQTKLQANSLQPDTEKLNQVFQGYEDRVNKVSEQILADPMSYRKMTSDIRQIGQDLHKDFTRGEISAIQGEYNKFQNYKAEQQKRVAEDKILQSELDREIQKSLSDYTQGGGVAGGASLRLNNLYDYVDMQKFMEEDAENMKATIVKTGGYDIRKDGLIYENETSTKALPASRIKHLVQQYAANNKPLMDYYKQKVQLDPNYTEQDFLKELDANSEAVANSFRQYEKTDLNKFKGWDPVKVHKAKKEIDEGKVYTPSSTITRAYPSNFTMSDNNARIATYKDEIKNIKGKLSRNYEGMPQEEIKKQYKRINILQSKVDDAKDLNRSAQVAAMQKLLDEGKGGVTGKDVRDFQESYLPNKKQIDSRVQTRLQEIKEESERLNVGKVLDSFGRRARNVNKNRDQYIKNTQNSLLNETLQADPDFAEDYRLYQLNSNLYNFNKGSQTRIIDGLSWENEAPNKLFETTFKKATEAQGQNIRFASLEGGNEDLDNQTKAYVNELLYSNPGSTKIYFAQKTSLKNGDVTPSPVKAEISTGVFGGANKPFDARSIRDLTGKPISEVLVPLGATSTGDTGTGFGYRYDAQRAAEAGLPSVSGVEDGDVLIFETPDANMSAYLQENYGDQNLNRDAQAVFKNLDNPLVINITNKLQNLPVEMATFAGTESAQTTFNAGSVEITATAKKDENGKIVYTLRGVDTNTGNSLETISNTNAWQLGEDYKDYLESKS